MAKLVRCELADVLPTLEAIKSLDASALGSGDPEDLFLCALGFEPRCLVLPDRLQKENYRVLRAIYFKYGTNLDDNAVNLIALENNLRGMSTAVEPMEVDSPDFPSRLRGLMELVISEAAGKRPRVTFDISVTANRLLLRCMKVLLEYDVSLRIVYSEAAVYHPTVEEYRGQPQQWADDETLGLERGVSDVGPSVDHPGHALDPLPDFLILFPSFKVERSKAVISFVDPALLNNHGDKVVWLVGVPHLGEDRWRVDAMREINEIGEDARQYEVSTFDYRETMRVLDSIRSELAGRYRVTISPLGSKMQALGTALVCYMYPDIRVILTMPKEYNAAQYSKGCKATWEIYFGPLGELRGKLDMVGTLRIDG